MNILPKKRWHVRTKDNIARVRRDEAKAAEEEKKREQRALLAEQEARTALLRQRAKEKFGNVLESEEAQSLLAKSEKTEEIPGLGSSKLEHVNFFSDLEQGETTHSANKEHEQQKKNEQEEYEKKIGLLTYLGQDTNELTGERSWWEKIPTKRGEVTEDETKDDKTVRLKDRLDPLTDIRKYLGCDGVQKYAKKSVPKVRVETASFSKRRRSRSSSRDSSSKSLKRAKKEKKTKRKKKKSKSSKKSKKHRKRSSSEECEESDEEEIKKKEELEKRKKLEKLRLERLAREKVERERANKLLKGETPKEKAPPKEVDEVREGKRKYNSQFNPEFAKQNKLDASKKYWLQQ